MLTFVFSDEKRTLKILFLSRATPMTTTVQPELPKGWATSTHFFFEPKSNKNWIFWFLLSMSRKTFGEPFQVRFWQNFASVENKSV